MKALRVSKALLILNALIVFGAFGAFGSGCGRIFATNIERAPKQSFRASVQAPLNSDGQFNCPSSPNVIPDYDTQLDGTGYYSICSAPDLADDVLIHGSTSTGSICVFPADAQDSLHVYVRPDVQGRPWSNCYTATDGGIRASFVKTSFNALFIVESKDRDQMTQCLATGNYYACPGYSFGKFRQ